MEQRSGRRSGKLYLEILLIIAILAILLAVLYPMFVPIRDPSRQSLCQSNVRQLLLSIQLYQQAHGNQFPTKATIWRDITYPPRSVLCPTYSDKVNGYGYNDNLSGLAITALGLPKPQNLPVLADSKAPGNLLNTPADIDFRHAGKAVVGYADGHVELPHPPPIPIAPIKKSMGGHPNGKH